MGIIESIIFIVSVTGVIAFFHYAGYKRGLKEGIEKGRMEVLVEDDTRLKQQAEIQNNMESMINELVRNQAE